MFFLSKNVKFVEILHILMGSNITIIFTKQSCFSNQNIMKQGEAKFEFNSYFILEALCKG
jgi:hypothetical protein